jgi:DNA-binding NtrC family response regulator
MSKISAGCEAVPPLPNIPCDDRSEVGAPIGGAGVAPFAFIVDDQEDICRFIATTLEALGIESAAFQSAKPAIAALDQRHPTIIFLDIALEQSDAIDVVKGLSQKHYDGIVQLMSGGKPWLLAAIERIASRYALKLLPPLQKPVGAEMIREAIAGAGLAPGAAL